MCEEQDKKQAISISFRKGITMPFMYKGHQIVVHNGSMSPREKIWVDDELIVNRWSLSMDSTQVIEVEGDMLILTYGIRNGMTEYFITAKVGSEVVYEASHKYRKDKVSNTSIIVSMLLGGLVGFFSIQLMLALF